MNPNINPFSKVSQNNTNQTISKSDIITDPETKIRYRKGQKLGGGGFGEVFEFIEIDTNKKRAAKIIPISRIDNDAQSNMAYNNENRFNTYLEFKYICKCFSTFKDNQNAYFILDYQPNKTLSELLSRRELSELEIKHYCFEILLAIEYLHRRNIIHRDIKLNNVLLSERMEVRLCDFGLAIENGIEGQKNICGTPNYIAPELLNHKNNLNYSFEVDIWAFGVILYTLFCRKTPFEQEVKGRTRYNIQNIIYTFPKDVQISKEAKELITSILKDASQRPKIEQIKASPFFRNGENIPKYLPERTMFEAMSPEEEENFVNNAIMNGECLDKDNNLPYGSSPIVKYYNKENAEIDDMASDYSASFSSSKQDDNNDNNQDNEQKENNPSNKNKINDKEDKIENKNNNKINNKGNLLLFSNLTKEENNITNKEDGNKNAKNILLNNLGLKHPTKKDSMNNFNNSKSFGKMNETAGFNNYSSNNSDFLFKEREDSSKILRDEAKNNESQEKNMKGVGAKFQLRHNTFKGSEKSISKNSSSDNSNDNKNMFNSPISRFDSFKKKKGFFSHKKTSMNKNGKKVENLINNNLSSQKNIVVNKYIDLSDKCGMGYILSNGDVGAYFNDGTKMIRIKSTLNFVYINREGEMESINPKKKTK